MHTFVRVFVAVMATLSATNAIADVRPFPGNPGPVSPIPGQDGDSDGDGDSHHGGHGYPYPGHPHPGPGYPHPGPGYPQPGPGYPQPGPGYPQPGPGYPQPSPTYESYSCRSSNGGYESIHVASAPNTRGANYIVDVNALGLNMGSLFAQTMSRGGDGMLLQFNTPYGVAQFNMAYLRHPYGPTGVLSLAGTYEQFYCKREFSLPQPPAPYPPGQPYPPSPYPPLPFPNPRR